MEQPHERGQHVPRGSPREGARSELASGAATGGGGRSPLTPHSYSYKTGELGLLICPLAVVANEIDQTLVGLRLRHGFFDDLFAHVQVDVAWRAADVAEVGVGHLARAVDDAAHDGDLH